MCACCSASGLRCCTRAPLALQLTCCHCVDMKAGGPAPPADAPRRRNQRDPEDIEDEQMHKNPRDYPFPAFNPSVATLEQQKRNAKKAIRDMVEGFVPVVPFSKPELVYHRPPWVASTFVGQHKFVPGLDLIAENEPAPPPEHSVSHPKWVTYIPRVVAGCPQLGLVMQHEPDGGLKSPRRPRGGAKTSRDVKSSRTGSPSRNASEADTYQLAQLKRSSATTPRYVAQSKDDVTLEMLKDPGVYKSVQKAVMEQRKGDPNAKSVLVSLPKIGVRLFSCRPSNTIPSPPKGRHV